MRLARARLTPIALPLRRPLATARGAIAQRRGWLLRLEADGAAIAGHGEALPLAGFSPEDAAGAGKALEELARTLLGAELSEPQAVLARLDASGWLREAPTAFAAAECALLDALARHARRSLAGWLADAAEAALPAELALSALAEALTPEALEAEARTLRAAGFGAVKLKLGALPLDQELERAQALRAGLGPELALRLDANRAYAPREAEALLAGVRELRPEYVEEPLAAPHARDPGVWQRLAHASGVALAADESLADSETAQALLGSGAARVAVLKPPALGGLRAARALALRARRAGAAVVVTSFLDSALGRRAAAALAASLPGPRAAAGLATGVQLAADLAAEPAPRRGRLLLSRAPGLGVAPDAERVARVATGAARELSC